VGVIASEKGAPTRLHALNACQRQQKVSKYA